MVLSALERMTRLVDVAAALSKTMTAEQVADVVTSLGLTALGARGGALLRIDGDSQDAVLDEVVEGQRLPAVRVPLASESPVATCVRTGRPFAPDSAGLCLPLLVRGHAIGALSLRFPDDAVPIGPEGLAFVEATVEQCAQALERARLYALEQVRREELEHSNRMKDDFLGIVSHELRTPLSAILGWARMLKRGMLASPRARERAVDAIERNAALQARLVDDLLDVSRIVNGKLSLDMKNVDVGAVVDAALDSVRPALLAKGFEVVTTPAEPIKIVGDPRRLQQVVWNLLSNAIKFTPAGGRIDVVVERDDRMARIYVRDTGIGIPGDVLPNVFDAFKQADGSATRQYGGLGLGLSIVRHVVEAHGGRVDARSDGEGRGAEMLVELPIAEADAPASIRVPESDHTARLAGTRVLLVDDDADMRDLLATALQAAGAELRAVGGTRAALEVVCAWHPNVIVSDIAMPGEDGYALIREVRALTPDGGGHTPAVALTAMARPTDRVRALSAGFQTHLAKPVDPRDLVLAVASLCAMARL